MVPSPCRSLRTHRCPQDASAGHCQALRHLHPLHRRLSQGPRPVVPLSLMSLSRSLRKGLLPASQRPPGAANRHDASLSSGSRSGQRHRPICEKKPPQSCAWGGFAECEVSVSVQRMEKARTPAARSPVFILRVGYGDSKKGWRRIPGASLFQFLGSVR